MSATFNWAEDNGTQTGSPLHGTTRTGFSGAPFATDVNWKTVDDCTNNSGTPFTAAAVQAGSNSMPKYTYGRFSGTFNSVFSGLFAHTAGNFPTGVTLKSAVTSTYATPSTSAVGGFGTDITTPISIGSGAAVLFATSGPENASPSSSIAAAGYSQYLGTQVQTTNSATQGDSAVITLTLQYNEN